MIDFGFDKIALIGAVALIVIGPEKLPRVARTAGHLLGKARRYVADVKAEVSRSIELEELKKMKDQFEGAARDVENTVRSEVNSATSGLSSLQNDWSSLDSASSGTSKDGTATTWADPSSDPLPEIPPSYRHPKKNWRLKRGHTPQWYKQRTGVRSKALSGAARVARFRPKPLSSSPSSSGAA